MLPRSVSQDQPRVSSPRYLAKQDVKVGCVPVFGRDLQEGSGTGVCLPAVSAHREAKMEVEEASGVLGEALHLTVEGGKVSGLSLEEVLLWVQEVGEVPGGQAAEEDDQEPVDGAFQVLPVLWGGEELRAPQQHHLWGGREGCGIGHSPQRPCLHTLQVTTQPSVGLSPQHGHHVLSSLGLHRLLELLLWLLQAQPMPHHPLVLNLCFTPLRAPISALRQVPALQQLRNHTPKLSAGTNPQQLPHQLPRHCTGKRPGTNDFW